MKKHDPEEVHQMRESLKQFEKVVKTVSVTQARLRESFAPPPTTDYVLERLLVPPKIA